MWRWAPAALLAGALAALAVALFGEGDDRPRPVAPAVATPAPAPADALAYPREGLRLARPAGWTAQRRGGVIRLRSSDGRVGVAILTSARGRVSRSAMRRDLERSARRSPGARVTSRSRAPLGDATALVSELTATGAGGAPAEIVVLAVASRWRTYGVTIFSSRPTALSAMPDVAAVLRSFEFAAPG